MSGVPSVLRAVRAPRAPAGGLRGDVAPAAGALWAQAPAVSSFLELEPREGKEPAFRTEVRAVYDDAALWVQVRAWDPEPGHLARRVGRRDEDTGADAVRLIVDGYHDRRTGYLFELSAGGGRRDAAIYADDQEDPSWDGTWEGRVAVDSAGWTAEFRLPFAELRFAAVSDPVFGFGVIRRVARRSERYSWPAMTRARAALASQLGELTGLQGIRAAGGVRLVPYALGRAQRGSAGAPASAGLDAQYPLASNLTLTATLNPDFGQVEADPAQVNLTAFETYLSERRPFFLEGAGLFRFDIGCGAVTCTGEKLFYPRRIGRVPQLADTYDAGDVAPARILGAGKLTGRLPGGFSLGVLDAATARVADGAGRTLEPATNYFVARATRELRGGRSAFGTLLTRVDRRLDGAADDFLRRDATVGALDARHRFGGGDVELSAYVAGSYVAGSRRAIAATQRDARHYFQRPGAPPGLDTTRTSLAGSAGRLTVRKLDGLLRFASVLAWTTPGFEPNDVGYLTRAGWALTSQSLGLAFTRPTRFYRSLNVLGAAGATASADRLLVDAWAFGSVRLEAPAAWWVELGRGQGLNRLCEVCARGGPVMRVDPWTYDWMELAGDPAKPVVPHAFVSFWRPEGPASGELWLAPSVELRLGNRLSTSLGAAYITDHFPHQWYGLYDDSAGTHRAFAELRQRTLRLTLRAGYSPTPTLSLQLYAEPFATRGAYSRIRELADPLAHAEADRYRPFAPPAGEPAGLADAQLHASAVLRWEYRPGSVLALVWTQERSSSGDAFDPGRLTDDYRALLRTPARGGLLIKGSYALWR